MEIRIRETGAVVLEHEFRAMHENVSMPMLLTPELLDSLGADPVLNGPQATGGTVYQYSMRDGVEQIDGKWYSKFVLGPVFTGYTDLNGIEHTAAEQEAEYKQRMDADRAAMIRAERNRHLKESDWTQVADSPVDKAAWAEYRQKLRDISAQEGFPWDVKWPTIPA